jgi:hypothetical protein
LRLSTIFLYFHSLYLAFQEVGLFQLYGGGGAAEAVPLLEEARRTIVLDILAMLREAVADGFKDAKGPRDEPALAPIRSTREFQAVMSDLGFPGDPFARPRSR